MKLNNEEALATQGWFPDEEVVEVGLLLPGREVAELEGLAHARGLTLGQLFRQLLRDYLVRDGGGIPPFVVSVSPPRIAHQDTEGAAVALFTDPQQEHGQGER